MYVHTYVYMYVRTYVCVHTAYIYNNTHITLQANFRPIHMAAAGGKVDILKYLGKLPGVDVHARSQVRM